MEQANRAFDRFRQKCAVTPANGARHDPGLDDDLLDFGELGRLARLVRQAIQHLN